MNREQWLTDVARQVQPLFRGYKLSGYRITCGWPIKRPLGTKNRSIGECHSNKSSKDGTFEIFISPLLDEPLKVSGVIVHEMAHVAAGVEAQHAGPFKVVCRLVGLEGKPTQAMPGEALNEKLMKILEKQGEYPHKAIVGVAKKVSKGKSSFSLACKDCGCKVTISSKWISEVGPPTCACGGEMLPPDEEEGEE